MLTKRTNILFEESMWEVLMSIADNKKTSVGELVRSAVYTVFIDPDDGLIQNRREAIAVIKSIKKDEKKSFSKKEIHELINYGRKD